MKFDWPADMASRFRKEIVCSTHDVHTSNLFSDEALADLLDRYPREKLGFYTFPPHSDGAVAASRCQAPTASGATLLEAVRKGRMWLNLRNVGAYLPEYKAIEDTVFEQFEAATGERTFKRDVGVLISSPNEHVHYHLDIPMVCLVHLRGQKTVYVYPCNEPFAPQPQVEGIALREQEEQLTFQSQFDKAAVELVMNPGDAVTWPQAAPHRVQNSDSLCVSLSCEFLTLPALIRANAIYTNGLLRRKLGLKPRLTDKIGLDQIAKAAIARASKLVNPPPKAAPAPIVFELDENTLELIELSPGALSALHAPA
ncbi:JmjC domain-containing protein [Methyloceanibacter methanicus]|uniref:JmjC domain-containing protein n=1 Tax=Methyloceanibacter methanicus TaxID=1774968 RepID=UPI0009F2039A|nr:cupin domain-containing protein [Methyloceanibacter methanicus]